MEVKGGKSKTRKRHFQAIGGTAQARIHDFICPKKVKLIQNVSSNGKGVGAQDSDSTSDKQMRCGECTKITAKYGKDGDVKNDSGVEVRDG